MKCSCRWFLSLVLVTGPWTSPLVARTLVDTEVLTGEAYVYDDQDGNVFIAVDQFERNGLVDGVTDRVFVFTPDDSIKQGLSIKPGNFRVTLKEGVLRLSSLDEAGVVDFALGDEAGGGARYDRRKGAEIVRFEGIGLAQYEGDFTAGIDELDVNDLFGLKATLSELGLGNEVLEAEKAIIACTQGQAQSCSASCGASSCSVTCYYPWKACCQCQCILFFCWSDCICI